MAKKARKEQIDGADFTEFGLGITGLNTVTNIDDINIPNGLYSVVSTNTGFGSSGSLLVERSGAVGYIVQKLQLINSGEIVRFLIRHFRPNSSAWTPFREVFHTGNLNPEQYMLSTTIVSDDWNAINKTGVYTNVNASTPGIPGSYGGITLIHNEVNSTYATQIAFRGTGTHAWFRSRNSTGWTGWKEFWHTDNFNPANYATTNEINNIYDQLSAKANTRLSNVAYDLSDVEKENIKNKIGVEKTSNYIDTDHLNNYGSGFFSGLVVDYSFFSDGRQEPDGKLFISALAEDGNYVELDKDVTEFSRHVVTQVGVSNVLVAEGVIKTSYSLSDFSNKSRDIYLVVLYDDTGATPLWKSVDSIKTIRKDFEGTAWLIGKLFVADNAVFFNVYPQII